MNKSLALGFNFAVLVAMVSLGLGIFYNPVQNALGAFNSPNSSIALSVNEVGGVYKWINATSGTQNPELDLKVNDNNTVQIQNPTDTKHELVIDLQGKEVAASGDIAPGASGQVSVRPNGTGLFSYHCEYHPDTMKGTIKLTD